MKSTAAVRHGRRARRLVRVLALSLALVPGSPVRSAELECRVSRVAGNGMPKNIVGEEERWNFGSGSLWTHKGWQYAAYWDDLRQVSVARRKLPAGAWAVVSLPDYQRTATGDRGKGGAVSRGFGDGHEKVALGISPDGVVHLSFDHHLSTLRYRASKLAVADDPESHPWVAGVFGPVRDQLGGGRIASVTYPSFYTDGTRFLLYLRLGGGSGAANSHLFSYRDGAWSVNSEGASQIIDQRWSGGDGTVNAYPFGLVIRDRRCHLVWCWRDTPDPRTCHDLCYAYSDDFGDTWRNNAGKVIGRRGKTFITADSPGLEVWEIPPGTRYVNGGSVAVDGDGRLHVLVQGESGRPVHFQRDPVSAAWSRSPAPVLGQLVSAADAGLFAVAEGGIHRFRPGAKPGWSEAGSSPAAFFGDCKPATDRYRTAHDGWVSTIGQQGREVRVVDFRVGPQR